MQIWPISFVDNKEWNCATEQVWPEMSKQMSKISNFWLCKIKNCKPLLQVKTLIWNLYYSFSLSLLIIQGSLFDFNINKTLNSLPSCEVSVQCCWHIIRKVIWYVMKLQIFEILCNIYLFSSSCLCPVWAVSVLYFEKKLGIGCMNIRKFIISSHIK